MEDEPYIDEPPKRVPRMVRVAITLSVLPLFGLAGWIASVELAGHRLRYFEIGALVWAGTCLLALVGIVQGLRAWRRGHNLGLLAVALGVITPPITLFSSLIFIPFHRGRAFRRRGRAQLPTTTPNDHWRTDVEAPAIDPELRPRVASAWRAMGATEAASIAAFSTFSQQLLAVGAPSPFLEMAHRDALDEIDHARRCYAIAGQIDGEDLGAAAFPAALLPAPPLRIRALAAECLRESCILEGASARAAREVAEVAHPALAETLTTIARDEARHATHGWDVLAWLVEEKGASVEDLLGVANAVRNERVTALADDDSLERWGIAGLPRWRAAVHASIDDAEQLLRAMRRRSAA
ncbi:MAG: ferritin-like domain-containing protein [Myxococcota bacterium]